MSNGDWVADIAAFSLSVFTLPQKQARFRLACPVQPAQRSAMPINPKALQLQARTHKLATRVITLCERLPTNHAAQQIAEQLVDSAGSTDSNYRATCRARSPDEFISKIGVAAEEADESKGWLQLLVSSNFATIDDADGLIQEADELTAIFVASRKTAQRRKAEREALQKQMRASSRDRRCK